MEYLSKQRYNELTTELKHLINEVYPKVQEELAEASAQGDRSDNAGYREAKRMQGKTISRIRFLQKISAEQGGIHEPYDEQTHEIRDRQPP